MKDMPIQNTIRDMYRRGESKSGIANALGIDRKTVRKYLEMDDFSPEPRKPKANQAASGCSPASGVIANLKGSQYNLKNQPESVPPGSQSSDWRNPSLGVDIE